MTVSTLVALTACSPGRPSHEPTTTSTSTRTPMSTDAVIATAPAVRPGIEDCGIQNALAGWPTTMVSSPDAYACIVDALAAGTPAQMSSITASHRTSGRTTSDGYDLPTRRITTWIVTGKDTMTETIDQTEDGGGVTTRTCTAFTEGGFGVPVAGTDCAA